MSNEILSIQNQLTSIFTLLDPLRDMLDETLDGWEPPVIVVFGDESAGKSTILERIAMLPIFPKGEGLCTRLCIRVVLRNCKDEKDPELYVMKRNAKTGRFEKHDGPGIISLNEGENLIRKKMLETLETEHAHINGISTTMRLELKLSGPKYPTLDLLDVPGLVMNPSAEQSADLPEQTRKLLESVIDETNERAVYLLIRPHEPEFKNSNAFNLFKANHTLKQSNTINVTTKWDEVSLRAIPKKMSKEISAPENQQFYASIFTSNPEDERRGPFDQSLQKQANEEVLFFENFKELQSEHPNQFGTNNLVVQIADLYQDFLKNSWYPSTAKRIHEEDSNIENGLQDLGLPPVETADEFTDELLNDVIESIMVLSRENITGNIASMVKSAVEPCLNCISSALKQHTKAASIIDVTPKFQYDLKSDTIWATIVNAMDQCIQDILTTKYNRICETIACDCADFSPKTTLRLGRFAELRNVLETLKQAAIEKLQQEFSQKLHQVYMVHQHNLLEFTWSKSTARLSSDGEKNLLQALEYILASVVGTPLWTQKELHATLSEISAEKWIEDCTKERNALYKRRVDLHDIAEQLYQIFKIDTSQAMRHLPTSALAFKHRKIISNQSKSDVRTYDCIWSSDEVYTRSTDWTFTIQVDPPSPETGAVYLGFCSDHHATSNLFNERHQVVVPVVTNRIPAPHGSSQHMVISDTLPCKLEFTMTKGKLSVRNLDQTNAKPISLRTHFGKEVPFRFFVEEFRKGTVQELPAHTESVQILKG